MKKTLLMKTILTLNIGGQAGKKRYRDKSFKACASRPNFYPPAIRNKCTSAPKLDKAQCEAAILAGNCIVCQEMHSYRQKGALAKQLFQPNSS